MNSRTHLRYQFLRTLRNRRLLFLTLALPLVIYFAVASGNRQARTDGGIAFPLYFMTGMAAYGALYAVISPGASIASERAKGWSRQLRTTPLPARTDLVARALTSYLVALPTLGAIYLAGAVLGVSLGTTQWLEMTGLLLVGLAPFVIIGYLVPVDAMAPAFGGVVVFFALFGGAWGQFFGHGAMLTAVKLLPSFWAVQAGKAALTGGDWPAEGWVVVALWTAALVPLAAFAFRRAAARA